MDRLDPVERLRGHLRQKTDPDARAAVAILLRRDGEDLDILLVKRAVSPSDPWSGDMAFPGGKRTGRDRGLMDTALREVMEETGIELEAGSYLGSMDGISSSIRPEMRVQPMVFLIEGVPELRLSGELSSYLWAPLGKIVPSRCVARVKNWDTQAFRVGGEVVWGLTYRMLTRLLEMLGEG